VTVPVDFRLAALSNCLMVKKQYPPKIPNMRFDENNVCYIINALSGNK
jgi:hypothetical protein